MNKLIIGIVAVVIVAVLGVVAAVVTDSAPDGVQAEMADAAVAADGCENCDQHGDHAAKTTTAAKPSNHYFGRLDAQGKASGPTLMAAYRVDTLYQCPMHPEIITDNPNAGCPTCGMNLTAMDADAVKTLQESDPKGCTMCPVIYAGDSDVESCSICGMKLMDPSKSHDGHGGGGHGGGMHGGMHG